MNNPYNAAKKQIDNVIPYLSSDYEDQRKFRKAIDLLKVPQKVHSTKLAVKMDNGKTKTFQAYRSQHNDARGPFKGGIRFHSNVSLDEVKALSTWMSIKCATVGIPYGGGKGGVIVDPSSLSESELQRLCHAYGEFIAPHIGAWVDVPAPDVNTGGREMAWMLEAYEKKVGYHSPATFTGKPIELGGSLGREEATGQGGVFILQKYTNVKKLNAKKVTVAIQGFGNVGYWFSFFADKLGYIVDAISDSSGALYSSEGLKPEKLMELKTKHGSFKEVSIRNRSKYKFLTNEELLSLNVDVLVPAALENAINAENAKKINAKSVLEMANGPTTPEAEEVLVKKGIDVLPDVLCNAGGVTVSYFEWVQNLHGYRWSKQRVNEELEEPTAFSSPQLLRRRSLRRH